MVRMTSPAPMSPRRSLCSATWRAEYPAIKVPSRSMNAPTDGPSGLAMMSASAVANRISGIDQTPSVPLAGHSIGVDVEIKLCLRSHRVDGSRGANHRTSTRGKWRVTVRRHPSPSRRCRGRGRAGVARRLRRARVPLAGARTTLRRSRHRSRHHRGRRRAVRDTLPGPVPDRSAPLQRPRGRRSVQHVARARPRCAVVSRRRVVAAPRRRVGGRHPSTGVGDQPHRLRPTAIRRPRHQGQRSLVGHPRRRRRAPPGRRRARADRLPARPPSLLGRLFAERHRHGNVRDGDSPGDGGVGTSSLRRLLPGGPLRVIGQLGGRDSAPTPLRIRSEDCRRRTGRRGGDADRRRGVPGNNALGGERSPSLGPGTCAAPTATRPRTGIASGRSPVRPTPAASKDATVVARRFRPRRSSGPASPASSAGPRMESRHRAPLISSWRRRSRQRPPSRTRTATRSAGCVRRSSTFRWRATRPTPGPVRSVRWRGVRSCCRPTSYDAATATPRHISTNSPPLLDVSIAAGYLLEFDRSRLLADQRAKAHHAFDATPVRGPA